MSNKKHGWGKIEVTDREFGVLFMFMSEFGDEVWVIRRGNWAPLIKQIEDAELLVVDKFK